jgi:PAS domain S-box-containing protein
MRATNTLESAFSQVAKETLPIVDALQDLRYYGALMVANTSELALALAVTDPSQHEKFSAEEGEEIAAAKAEYGNALDRYRRLVTTRNLENNAITLDLINYSSGKLMGLLDQLVQLQKSQAPTAVFLEKMELAEGYEMSLLATIDAALAGEVELFTARKKEVSRSILYTRNTTAGIGPLSILVAILIAIYISRMVVRIVLTLKNASLAMAAGNLDIRVPRLSRDEFGDLARSFNDMASSLKEKNNELNAARAYLDEIINTTGDLIVITDPENLIRTVDQAMIELSGRDPGKLQGTDISELFGPHTGRVASEKWLPRLKDGVAIRDAEITLVDRNGKEIPAVVSVSIIRDQKQIIHGYVYVGHIVGTTVIGP